MQKCKKKKFSNNNNNNFTDRFLWLKQLKQVKLSSPILLQTKQYLLRQWAVKRIQI